MAVAFGAAGTVTGAASGTSVTPALPAGLVAGNLMIAACGTANNATHTWPAGWNKAPNQTNSGASWTSSWAWRVATASESAPAVSWTGSAGNTAQVWSYTGADPAVPIGTFSTVSTGSTATHTSIQVTTVRDNSLVIYIDTCANTTTLTQPTGWTQDVSNAVIGTISTGHKLVAANGTGSGGISTTGGAAAWTQWQVELLILPSGIMLTNIQNNAGASGATLTVGPVQNSNVPANVHIFVGVCENANNPAVGSVSDTGNSTAYTYITTSNSAGAGQTVRWYVLPAAANVNGVSSALNQLITYTKGSSTNAGAMTCLYASNLTPADIAYPRAVNVAQGNSAVPSVTQTGVVATGGLLLGLLGWGTTGTFTQDSTHAAYETPPNANTLQLANNAALAGGSFVTTGSAVSIYAPTLSASGNWAESLLIYNPGPVGAPGVWSTGSGPWGPQDNEYPVRPILPPNVMLRALTARKFFGAGGQVPTKRWLPHYVNDDPGVWTDDDLQPQGVPPILGYLAGHRARSPFYAPRPPDLAEWLGTPLGSDVLHPLLTAAGIPPTPFLFVRWGAYDDSAQWQGTPMAVPDELQIKPAPFQPDVHWNNHYDDQAIWQGTPLSSDTLHPLLTAAGIVTAEQWKWGYDDGAFWLGTPISIGTVQRPLGTPFTPDVHWRNDYAEDALWGPSARSTNLSIAASIVYPASSLPVANGPLDDPTWQITYRLNNSISVVAAPFAPDVHWNYGIDDPPMWQGTPLSSDVIRPLLTAAGVVKAKFWRWDHDVGEAFWNAAPLSSDVIRPLLTAAGQPPTKRWRYDYDADSWWQQWVNLNRTLVSSLALAPFVPAKWPAHYAEDALWGASPQGSALLRPLLTAAGIVRARLWRWDYDDAQMWQGAPVASDLLVPILTTGGQPPTKSWHYDYDDSSGWQAQVGIQSMPLVLFPAPSGVLSRAPFWAPRPDDPPTWALQQQYNSMLLTVKLVPFAPDMLRMLPQPDDPPPWLQPSQRSTAIAALALPVPFGPNMLRMPVQPDDSAIWRQMAELNRTLFNTLAVQPPFVPDMFSYALTNDDTARWQFVPPFNLNTAASLQFPTGPHWGPELGVDDPALWSRIIGQNLSLLSKPLPPFVPIRWPIYYDDAVIQSPQPVRSALLQPLLTAAGQVRNRQQRYDYDVAESQWLILPQASRLLVPVLTAQVPTKPWRWDHDADSWWSLSWPYNLAIGLPQFPKVAPQRLFNYDDSSFWRASPIGSALLVPLLTQRPFAKFWRYDYDVGESQWPAQPLSAFTTLFLSTARKVPFPGIVWHYEHNSGETYFRWMPPNSPPLYIPRPAAPTALSHPTFLGAFRNLGMRNRG